MPAVCAELRRCTLDKPEDFLGPFLAHLAALDPARASARERPSSVRRTWWGFLWQMLQVNATCRDVVSQIQAVRALTGQHPVDDATNAYCQARARLPESLLVAALRASAAAADQRVPAATTLQGRVVKVLDGTTLPLPDTAKNRASAAPSYTCSGSGARVGAVCSTTCAAPTATARCACSTNCSPR